MISRNIKNAFSCQVLLKAVMFVVLCMSADIVNVSAQGYYDRFKRAVKSAWNSRNYTVPITGREFTNLVPDDYLYSESASQYRSFIRSHSRSSSSQNIAQVKRVSQRLAQACKKFYHDNDMEKECQRFSWEFNVVKSSEMNAFCMPGGKIVVYDGIIPVAGDDASLAMVIGHEIGHAIAKHSSEQMTKTLISVAGLAIITGIISSSDMSSTKKYITSLLASAGVTLLNLKYSRQNETEADRIGMIIAAMAGYNPEAAVGFWQRMGKASGSKSARDWYSTHPSNSNRISNIKSFVPEARQYYNAH